MKIKYSLKPIVDITFSDKTRELLKRGGFEEKNNFEALRKAKIKVLNKMELSSEIYSTIDVNIEVLRKEYYKDGRGSAVVIYKGALEEMRRYKKIEDIEKFD